MLRTLTLDEVVEVTGGALVDGPNVIGASGEETCTSVSTDTRTIEPGALFVALKGEKHDAHEYLVAAKEKGATGLLVSRTLTLNEAQLPHVVVADTLHALGDIARYVRDAFTGPVVGVTGSVGKTTAKEMIALALGAQYNVHKTAANYNNEIGVPQTIFSMTAEHSALVVEMGMRGPGQIRWLAEIAAPTIGVITGIGLSHIELLGSRDNIAAAKGELFECLPEADGLAIYPADDPFAATLRARFKGKSLSCAIDAVADVRATNARRDGDGWKFTVESPWGTQKMYLPSPGRFNILNALFAVAAAGHVGVSLEAIANALRGYVAPPMRLEILKSAKGATILSDAYNAAPDSMIGALQTLQETPVGQGGKRIAVLGEMRELGSFANDAHSMVGRAAGKIKPDMLVTVGEMGRKIVAGAMVNGFSSDHIHQMVTTEQAAALVPAIVRAGDVVLVKGSRAMAMEKIVEALQPIYPAPPVPSVPPTPIPVPESVLTPAEPIAEPLFVPTESAGDAAEADITLEEFTEGVVPTSASEADTVPMPGLASRFAIEPYDAPEEIKETTEPEPIEESAKEVNATAPMPPPLPPSPSPVVPPPLPPENEDKTT
jgi:UDP-N-acetylmuramoyl-tripeptide--D-alanyl-D-alanine ligase